MESQITIDAPARFLWQGSDGAMHMAVGRTRSINDHGLFVESESVPSAGAAVQVLVDMSLPDSVEGSGRLVGKGIVLNSQDSYAGKRGFTADVELQPLFAPQTPAFSDSVSPAVANSSLPIGTGSHISTQPDRFGSANMKAGRIFAAVALLVLMFAGKISHKSSELSHRTSFDMTRAPYHANVSTW